MFSSNLSVSLTANNSTENPFAADITFGAGDSSTPDNNEQYKRKIAFCNHNLFDKYIFSGLSVKERARMLTTTATPTASNDKKTTSPSSTTGNY